MNEQNTPTGAASLLLLAEWAEAREAFIANSDGKTEEALFVQLTSAEFALNMLDPVALRAQAEASAQLRALLSEVAVMTDYGNLTTHFRGTIDRFQQQQAVWDRVRAALAPAPEAQ